MLFNSSDVKNFFCFFSKLSTLWANNRSLNYKNSYCKFFLPFLTSTFLFCSYTTSSPSLHSKGRYFLSFSLNSWKNIFSRTNELWEFKWRSQCANLRLLVMNSLKILRSIGLKFPYMFFSVNHLLRNSSVNCMGLGTFKDSVT